MFRKILLATFVAAAVVGCAKQEQPQVAATVAKPGFMPEANYVFFGSGRTDPDDEGMAVIEAATRRLLLLNPRLILITGHADRSGDQFNNLVLSAKRAANVGRLLAERGVAEEKMVLRAFGAAERGAIGLEDDPLNRRVSISWLD